MESDDKGHFCIRSLKRLKRTRAEKMVIFLFEDFLHMINKSKLKSAATHGLYPPVGSL